jgi:hypothetical protein
VPRESSRCRAHAIRSGCKASLAISGAGALPEGRQADAPVAASQVEALVGGAPEPPSLGEEPVAVIKWVDGTLIDTVWRVVE